jgi:dihydrofolate reductase
MGAGLRMRKLKLQMQMSIDGVVGRHGGQEGFNWDQEVRRYSIENASSADCLLIGRKIAPGFIGHWRSVAEDPAAADQEFGALITNMPKVVFSRTLAKSEWPNTTVVKGELVERVNYLKAQPGKDLLVYGGHGLAMSLVNHGLVDEFHLLVNPMAFGSGLTIFSGLEKTLRLELTASKAFSSGSVLLRYESLRA